MAQVPRESDRVRLLKALEQMLLDQCELETTIQQTEDLEAAALTVFQKIKTTQVGIRRLARNNLESLEVRIKQAKDLLEDGLNLNRCHGIHGFLESAFRAN